MRTSNTRLDILQSALSMFKEKGYHSTTLNDIIQLAGVSKGAFYHYFDHKEDVLFLIHEEFIGHVLERANQIVLLSADAPDIQLSNLIVNLVMSLEQFQNHVTVFFQEQRVFSEEKVRRVKEKERQYVSLIREVIERGSSSGVFRPDVDPTVVSFGVLGMCNWMYKWFHPEGRVKAQDIANTFAEITVNGLRVNSRRAAGADKS